MLLDVLLNDRPFKQCWMPAFDEYVMQLDTEPFNVAISQTSNSIRVHRPHYILLSVKHDGFYSSTIVTVHKF